MKNSKLGRILLLLACAVLLVCLSVGATLAYLTSSDTNVNTFTVGDVKITLDEAEVTNDGRSWVNGHDQRVKKNEYHLQPAQTYLKDPTVTVKANSENCYVRMLVTVNDVEKLQKAFPVVEGEARNTEYWYGDIFLLEKIVTDYDPTAWVNYGYSNGTYEFRYKNIVETYAQDQKLPDLFTSIVVPGTPNNTEMKALAGLEITVVAQAIQSDNFKADGDKTAEDVAWEAFAQNYHDFNEANDKAALVKPETETEGKE